MEFVLAFATILQLIGVYRAEKGAREEVTRDNFLAWLVNHKHDELKEFIVDHAEFDSEVTALLQRDHDAIRSDLRALNEIAVGIAERLDSFASIARQTPPSEALSDQALQVLVLFAETEGDTMTLTPISGEKWPVLVVYGNNYFMKNIGNFHEPRLINDDLDLLTDFKLLTEGSDESGFRVFHITRKALQFVGRLNREKLFAD